MKTITERITSHVNTRRSLPEPSERRRIREDAGLSQKALADLMGVSQQAIYHWENGNRFPRQRSLTKYVEALDALKAVSA